MEHKTLLGLPPYWRYFNIDVWNYSTPSELLKALLKSQGLTAYKLFLKLPHYTCPHIYNVINGRLKISKKLSEEIGEVLNIPIHLLYKLRLENDIKEIQKEINKLKFK